MSKQHRKLRPRHSAPLVAESLEDRKLMTCDMFSIEFSDGVLILDGTRHDDHMTVSSDARDNSRLIVRQSVSVGGDWIDCGRRFVDADAVDEILIRGLEGNDYIVNSTGIRDEIHGGDGDDEIRGGEAASLIFGGNGNDELQGRGGDDEIYGEAGADTLLGGVENDLLFGGHGTDTLVGGYGDDYLDAGFQVGIAESVWGDLRGGTAGHVDGLSFGQDHFVVHKFYGEEYGTPLDAHARDVPDDIEYIDHVIEWEPVSPVAPIGPIFPF